MLFIHQIVMAEVIITKTMVKALMVLAIVAALTLATLASVATLVAIGGTLALVSVPFGAVAIVAILFVELARQQITSVNTSEQPTIEQDEPLEEQVIIDTIPSTEWLESELAYLADHIRGEVRYLAYSIPQIIDNARWDVGTVATVLSIPVGPKGCYPYWTNGEEEDFAGLLIPTTQATVGPVQTVETPVSPVKLTKKPTTKVKKAPKSTSPSKAPSIALEALTWPELLAFARTHKVPVGTKGRTRKIIESDLLKVIRQ